jgi:hypothetical protein
VPSASEGSVFIFFSRGYSTVALLEKLSLPIELPWPLVKIQLTNYKGDSLFLDSIFSTIDLFVLIPILLQSLDGCTFMVLELINFKIVLAILSLLFFHVNF